MSQKNKFWKYFKEYRWSNIFAMIRNSGLKPEICTDDCKGKFVVISGATSGVGRAAAEKFASKGASLLTINRNKEKSEKLCNEIREKFGTECDYILADLSILADIYRAAEEIKKLNRPIDVLIHNAGVYLTKRVPTRDGLDTVFTVHYLSSFIINEIIKKKLKEQGRARIIFVGSEGHRFAAWGIRTDDLNWQKRRYSGLKSYGSAKTAQMLSMFYFKDYFADSGVTINSMHPGAVRSGTGKENGPVYRKIKDTISDKFLKSPDISGEALYYLGVSPQLSGVSGKFFNLTKEEEPAPPALDRDIVPDLIRAGRQLGKLPRDLNNSFTTNE